MYIHDLVLPSSCSRTLPLGNTQDLEISDRSFLLGGKKLNELNNVRSSFQDQHSSLTATH